MLLKIGAVRRLAHRLSMFCVFSAAVTSLPALAQQPGGDADLPYHTDFVVKADPALHAKLPAAVQKAGYIVAGTNPNTPPTTFYGPDNQTLEGREIDIMTAIAHRLGVQVHWREVGGFDNIIPGLSTGRFQTALANLGGDARAPQAHRLCRLFQGQPACLCHRR